MKLARSVIWLGEQVFVATNGLIINQSSRTACLLSEAALSVIKCLAQVCINRKAQSLKDSTLEKKTCSPIRQCHKQLFCPRSLQPPSMLVPLIWFENSAFTVLLIFSVTFEVPFILFYFIFSDLWYTKKKILTCCNLLPHPAGLECYVYE